MDIETFEAAGGDISDITKRAGKAIEVTQQDGTVDFAIVLNPDIIDEMVFNYSEQVELSDDQYNDSLH